MSFPLLIHHYCVQSESMSVISLDLMQIISALQILYHFKNICLNIIEDLLKLKIHLSSCSIDLLWRFLYCLKGYIQFSSLTILVWCYCLRKEMPKTNDFDRHILQGICSIISNNIIRSSFCQVAIVSQTFESWTDDQATQSIKFGLDVKRQPVIKFSSGQKLSLKMQQKQTCSPSPSAAGEKKIGNLLCRSYCSKETI